jgi:hypothetical protein
MEWPLFLELIHHTKRSLDSIKKYTKLSRGRFSDKEFGEFFYRMITREIEKNDLAVNSFLNYIKVTSPIRKKGTVNTLIEEVLKKYQVQLEENKIKIFRNFEKDLPETIVPDEQLRFILDSILQYAMASVRSDGAIEFLTKSSDLRRESREEAVFRRDGKYIEILVVFSHDKKSMERPMQKLSTPALQEEFVSDVLLRLVDATVKMNQGVTRLEVGETKAKKSVFLKLPEERRKVVFYESTRNNQQS